MKIVIFSDTHGYPIDLPDGDLLLFCGDACIAGTLEEISKFNSYLGTQSHKHKVMIAGNHDIMFEKSHLVRQLITSAIYLQDETVNIEGINIYGSPWQPSFMDWAFGLDTEEELKAKWDLIPNNTDILMTHCPPRGILDRAFDGKHHGCLQLKKAFKPKLHAFGHIHESYGQLKLDGTTYVNASICNLTYFPMNRPIVIEEF